MREAAPVRRLACFLAALAVALPALAAGPLDGRHFAGDTGPVGRAADEHGAVLSFADGRLAKSSPASCASDSFLPGEYTAVPEGDGIRFRATTTSDEYGRIDWEGVVRGDTLEGRYVWHRKPSFFVPDPKPYAKWFKAVATHR
jgi:hypothetical protein